MRLPTWMPFAAALVVVAPSARAEPSAADKAAAQALFDQAKELLAHGRVADACPKLEESLRLDPTSGTLINLADCYEREGKTASAWSTFLQAASASRLVGHIEREQVARERAATLALHLPKIVIQVANPDAAGLEVKRDGVSVGKAQWGTAIPADPGQHRVVAAIPGKTNWETVVTLRSDADVVTVAVPSLGASSAPVAASESRAPDGDGVDAQRGWAIAAGSVGLAGVVAGTTFGLISKSKHDEANQHCDGSVCRDQRGVDLRDEARHAGTLSTVGFLVGLAGLAGGATLWLTAKSDRTPSVGVALGTVVVSQAW